MTRIGRTAPPPPRRRRPPAARRGRRPRPRPPLYRAPPVQDGRRPRPCEPFVTHGAFGSQGIPGGAVILQRRGWRTVVSDQLLEADTCPQRTKLSYGATTSRC